MPLGDELERLKGLSRLRSLGMTSTSFTASILNQAHLFRQFRPIQRRLIFKRNNPINLSPLTPP